MSRVLRLLELAGVISVTSRVTGRNKTTLQSTKDPVRAAIGPLLEISPHEQSWSYTTHSPSL
jgi:hypothetical protein